MVSSCDINRELLRAKLCSSDFAVKYVDAVRYGHVESAERLFNTMVILEGAIRIFEDYELTDGVYAEAGYLYRFNKKALLSTNNSLSLESTTQKVDLTEGQLNCFIEEELCRLADKVKSICSNC